MPQIEVHKMPTGRVKHNEKTWDFDRFIDDVDICYIGSESKTVKATDVSTDAVRNALAVDVNIYIPHGEPLTAQERVVLPDDPALYRVVGKPLIRRNDRTSTVFKTKVQLVTSEG